jgi:hypothetical protein
VRELTAIHKDLRKAAAAIKRDLQTNALFEARPFADLVVTAGLIARGQIASLRRQP